MHTRYNLQCSFRSTPPHQYALARFRACIGKSWVGVLGVYIRLIRTLDGRRPFTTWMPGLVWPGESSRRESTKGLFWVGLLHPRIPSQGKGRGRFMWKCSFHYKFRRVSSSRLSSVGSSGTWSQDLHWVKFYTDFIRFSSPFHSWPQLMQLFYAIAATTCTSWTCSCQLKFICLLIVSAFETTLFGESRKMDVAKDV